MCEVCGAEERSYHSRTTRSGTFSRHHTDRPQYCTGEEDVTFRFSTGTHRHIKPEPEPELEPELEPGRLPILRTSVLLFAGDDPEHPFDIIDGVYTDLDARR